METPRIILKLCINFIVSPVRGFQPLFFINIDVLESKWSKMSKKGTKIAKNDNIYTLWDLRSMMETPRIIPKLFINLIPGLVKGVQSLFS